MEAILGSLDAASAGSGRLEIVSGSAGIGKTRLTYEVATVARGRGFEVLRGGCWESEGAPAYWAWSEVLRQHLGSEPAPGNSADFSQLLDAAATRAGVPIRGIVDATKEAQQARFMLFDRFCEFLAATTTAQPLLLIIDDAHWADAGSLLLLQFLAGRLARMRLAVIVTSREPLSELAASTTRHPWARHRVLRGLTRAETRTLIAACAARAPRRPEFDRIMHLTEGNPYFVKELGQLLADGQRVFDAEEAIQWPANVLAITLQPYNRLSLECRILLQAASVVGREFDAEVAADAARLPIRDALPLLDEAVAHRVITHLDTTHYQFVHALVREAILDQLHPSDRMRLHEATALTLQRRAAAGEPVSTAALAHHFCRGLPLTQRRQAAEYCIDAGDAAHAAFAYEEAVSQLRRAQALSGAVFSQPDSCDLLLKLGAAEAGAGEWAQSRRTFEDAAALARRLRSPERLARAALGFKGLMWGTIPVDCEAITLLEEAQMRLGDRFPSLTVEILSALSRSLYFSPNNARADMYSASALGLASHLSDTRLHAHAIETHSLTLLRPGRTHELLDSASTLLELGDDIRDPQVRFNARMFRQFGLLSTGRLIDADHELELAAQISESSPYPRFRWQIALVRVARATMRGSFAHADRLSRVAYELGSRVHDNSPLQYHLLQSFQRTQLRRDATAWAHTTQDALAQLPHIPAIRVAHAWILAHTSHLDLATEFLHELAGNSFQCIPPNHLFLYLLAVLADVAVTVSSIPHATTLYNILLPYASDFIVTAWGSLVDGSVSHYLGLLAQSLGMDSAGDHFRFSIDANRQLGAAPFTARSSLHLAHFLLSHDEDPSAALSLAAQAARTFSSLNLDHYAMKARSLCDTIARGGSPSSEVPAAPEAPNALRRNGDFWTFSYKGESGLLRPTLGLQYIAVLLARPRTPVHVLDLVAGAHGRVVRIGEAAGAESDIEARTSYRRRLQELAAEIDEADSNNDVGRRELLSAERESLLRELSRAFALSGSPRPSGSIAEKARISVRNRITSAFRTIQCVSPNGARFLELSITTGSFCQYDPIEPTTWQL